MVATDPIVAAPLSLVVLIVSIALLALRAWLGVNGVAMGRRSAFALNGLIVVSVALFGLLVVARFAALA